jgi:hypothetical protein
VPHNPHPEHWTEPIRGDSLDVPDSREEGLVIYGQPTALNKAADFASLRQDVMWLYENLDRCIMNRKPKKSSPDEPARVQINFFRASRAPTSKGVIGWLKAIAVGGDVARRKFYEDHLSVLPKESPLDQAAEVPEELVQQEEADLIKLHAWIHKFTKDFKRKQQEKAESAAG